MRLLVPAALLAILAPPGPARADGAPSPVVAHASWALGPLAACATPAGISDDVSALLGHDVFTTRPEDADRRLRIEARQDSIDAWILTLRVLGPDGDGAVRRLFPGQVSCAAARRSLVEMLVLALDYARPDATPGPRVQAPIEPEPTTPPPPPRWSARLGLDASVGRGLLPGTHGGVTAVVAVTPPASDWSAEVEGTVWGPATASTAAVAVPTGLRLWAWHLAVGGCRRFGEGAPLELATCLAAVAGQVFDERSYPQSDAVGSLGDREALWGLQAGVGLATSSRAPVQLVVRLAALFPLSLARERYAVCSAVEPRCGAGDASVVLHEPSWVVPRLDLGLRWRIE